MMKFYLSLFLLVGSVLVHCHQDDDIHENEDQFDSQFHIKYASKEDRENAAKNLAKAEEEINKQNKAYNEGRDTFAERLYDFSNLDKKDFIHEKLGVDSIPKTPQGRALGLIVDPLLNFTHPELEEFYSRMATVDRGVESWDSRANNWVTSVKNQQSCGSCAAFSATSLHESCMLKAGARMNGLDLSEQYLIDCGYNGSNMNGCNGASPDGYQTWFASNKGEAAHEADYPYADANPTLQCNTAKKIFKTGAKVDKALADYNCNEDKMAQLVQQYGSVSVAIHASDDSFGNYNTGVYRGCTSTQINHAVTVVGFGVENGAKYWLVKNSWGSNWGQNGYIKIERGTNQCGISRICTVVTCSKTNDKPSDPPVTPAPAPIPASQTCDISDLYGRKDINGRYQLRIRDPNGNELASDVTCTNSVCKPSMPGPSNACMYICGRLKCGNRK